MITNADILSEIESFIAERGLPRTSFGRAAIGDANLIDNLRAGRELRRSTEQKVRTFMAEYGDTPEHAEAA